MVGGDCFYCWFCGCCCGWWWFGIVVWFVYGVVIVDIGDVVWY